MYLFSGVVRCFFIHNYVKAFCCCSLKSGHYVAVSIKCDLYAAMSEAFLHYLWVYSPTISYVDQG
jgi:hypothetical protein